MHVYEVRSREDKRGVDLISDVLPFGRLWYTEIRRNRIHETSQPLTLCCDSRLRSDWQRDRNARAQEWVQRVVSLSPRPFGGFLLRFRLRNSK
jgi:hypothetical protein